MFNKALIIDDCDYKIQDIKRYLAELGVENIIIKKSRNEGLIELSLGEDKGKPYDLLVLDMVLPNYPKGKINHHAGFDVLREMIRKEWKTPVILCSGDPIADFSEYTNVLGAIQYNKSVCQTENFRNIICKWENR